MDATEKIAKALHEAEWFEVGGSTRDWSDIEGDERAHYLAHARYMLAAFPQLALEGREETIQHRCTPGCSDREMCLLAIDNGPLTRTVYETEWSEVQS